MSLVKVNGKTVPFPMNIVIILLMIPIMGILFGLVTILFLFVAAMFICLIPIWLPILILSLIFK